MEEKTYTSQQLSAILNVHYGSMLKTIRDSGSFHGVMGKPGPRRVIFWSEDNLRAIQGAIEAERQYYLVNPQKKMPQRLRSRPMRQPRTLSLTSLIQISLSTTSRTIEMEWKQLADEHLKKSFKTAEINGIIDELNQYGRCKRNFEGGFWHLFLLGD